MHGAGCGARAGNPPTGLAVGAAQLVDQILSGAYLNLFRALGGISELLVFPAQIIRHISEFLPKLFDREIGAGKRFDQPIELGHGLIAKLFELFARA